MTFNKKKIGMTSLMILALLQFYRPAKNDSNSQPAPMSAKYAMPADIEQTFKTACFDCHSNYTVYPWYANIQPVGIWLTSHVNEGKEHLNFSDFTRRRIAIQNHKLDEMAELIENGDMPLSSYTIIHRDAILTPEKKSALLAWTHAQMDSLSAHYPADSLVLKRPK